MVGWLPEVQVVLAWFIGVPITKLYSSCLAGFEEVSCSRIKDKNIPFRVSIFANFGNRVWINSGVAGNAGLGKISGALARKNRYRNPVGDLKRFASDRLLCNST